MEGLANLDQLPAVGMTIILGAPKIAGATGGPTRAFALV
jgi:kynurenine formamidase